MAALEERDVSLVVLLDGGVGVIGGMGLSVGQRLALERALRQCEVRARGGKGDGGEGGGGVMASPPA